MAQFEENPTTVKLGEVAAGAADHQPRSRPWRRRLMAIFSLAVAAAVWLPTVHLLYREPEAVHFDPRGQVPPKAQQLAARHLRLWSEPALRQIEITRMRRSNAEWDFMGRSFFVWSLCEMALRDPALKPQALQVADTIIAETLRLERQHGPYVFLMSYARAKPWVMRPVRSQFLDGELAMMMAARRLVEEKAEYRPLLAARVEAMVARMEQSPVLSAESYPDECWTFCNTIALAAIRSADRLDGTDHSDLLRRWVAAARQKLVDPQTGIIISAYTVAGRELQPPEGSSIWVSSYFLQFVDRDFAAEQYRLARRQLGRVRCGFGYAREWASSRSGRDDIDSGPVVPLLDASAGSSGCAFVAAAGFADQEFLGGLWSAVALGGFPIRDDPGGLRYAASNQVGDAVMLYSTVLGPLRDKVIGEKTTR